jgi:hypothetical protein
LENPKEITHWESIFDSCYHGQIDTWDYQWVFTCWRQGGLAIHPNENLVSNIGFGPDATHFKEDHSTLGIPIRELEELVHPTEVLRDRDADLYTYEEHIHPKKINGGGHWLLQMKRRLAIRTRMKRMLPRSLRYRSTFPSW